MRTEVIFPLILAVVLLIVLMITVRMLLSKKHLLLVAFFAFAVACCLFSTLYWVAYDILRPEETMPFAANEICEWAMFLLLASSLRTAFPQELPIGKAVLPAAFFAAANTGLWIVWSGEWMQDILTGLSFGWCLCVLAACLLASEAFSRAEWIGICTVAFLLIPAQILTFVVSPAAADVLDRICSVLLFAADFFIILKTVSAIKNDSSSRRGLALSFTVYIWSTVAMYMSSGWVYSGAMLLASLGYLLMLLAIRKEVKAK